jgi:hypothetical protein
LATAQAVGQPRKKKIEKRQKRGREKGKNEKKRRKREGEREKKRKEGIFVEEKVQLYDSG